MPNWRKPSGAPDLWQQAPPGLKLGCVHEETSAGDRWFSYSVLDCSLLAVLVLLLHALVESQAEVCSVQANPAAGAAVPQAAQEPIHLLQFEVCMPTCRVNRTV